MIAGPALAVSTREPATEEWFSSILIDDDQDCMSEDGSCSQWWQRQSPQSDRAVLVEVISDPSDSAAATEIVLYASLATQDPVPTGILTPPRSSSPGPGEQDQGAQYTPSPALYALPLNSRHNGMLQNFSKYKSTDDASWVNGEAQFLDSLTTNHVDPSAFSRKRRKLSAVFDEATHQRRKTKGRGGERISRAMAETNSLQPQRYPVDMSTPEQGIADTEQRADDVQPNFPQRRSLSRASSIMSLPNLEDSRPASRRGTFVAGKRSSLNRVESVASGLGSPILGDNTENGFEAQNKATLARIVMAGMRMYGLQQKKTKTQPSSLDMADLDYQQATVDDHDEYKAIYHQTFKAASFTFRAHFVTSLVSQDTVREIVDQLLSIFCSDPLTSSSATDLLVSAPSFGSQQEQQVQDAFDLPSLRPAESMTIGTPSSRKKISKQ